MATRLSNPRDLLLALLGDLLFVERRLAGEVLANVTAAVRDEELRATLAGAPGADPRARRTGREAFRRIEAAPSANLSRAFEGAVSQHADIAAGIADPVLADVFHAASALRVEYHEIAGYRAATRIARALGRADVVEVLEKSLGDEERAAATVDDALARLAAAGRYSR